MALVDEHLPLWEAEAASFGLVLFRVAAERAAEVEDMGMLLREPVKHWRKETEILLINPQRHSNSIQESYGEVKLFLKQIGELRW